MRGVEGVEMCMLDEIHAKRDEIYAIARKHKAEKLWVFGSCARKEERPDSDIDLLVKFSPDATFKDFVRTIFSISFLLSRGLQWAAGFRIIRLVLPVKG